jgi:glycosyltransferase involved in cell wall biosynthesis
MIAHRRVDFPLRRNALTRWKYGRARAIIAVSEAVARVLVASGVDRDRIRVIPDGVDLTRCAEPASRASLAALGVPAASPLVVQVSALVPHKDPLTFVGAVAEARRAAPALHALVVGEGPLRPAVDSAVRDLGLRDVVHLTGFRSDAEALLAAADVAVLSSREEGLGSVLLEAMALGVPIAATRAGGIPELVAHGETGLLAPPGDPRALGGAIATLLANAELRRGLAARARLAVRDYSAECMVARTSRVYAEVLRAGGCANLPAMSSS